MLRRGRNSYEVQDVLSEKYNVGEREVRDWLKAAREILSGQLQEEVPYARQEAVLAFAELHRMARQEGDTRSAGWNLREWCGLQGLLVTRVETTNHNLHADVPMTPAEMAEAVARIRGCTPDEAAQWLADQGAG